jgi:hypothetical protein
MSTREARQRLSRRQLLRAVGAGSLAAATLSAGSLAIRPALAATSNQEDSPEGFLAYAYRLRAQAMLIKDGQPLEAIYDTANPQALAFEKERAILDVGARWDGTILNYDTAVSLIDLNLTGSVATARIYETIRVLWIQNPVTISPALLKLRRQEPAKYASLTPRSPRGEITSVVGTRHEVVLEKHATGWRLVRDAYEEPNLFAGVSPDLVPRSWAAVWFGKPSNSDLHIEGTPEAGTVPSGVQGTYTYRYVDAMNYAKSHCTASTYNTSYCNFNGNYCGGDCANFVSQSFYAGGQVKRGDWSTYNGKCGRPECQAGNSPNAGRDSWANNRLLRDWYINNGCAYNAGDLGYLGIGDIINYDWTCNGSWDHVTILVQPSYPNGALICSHNTDLCNAPWSMGGACSYSYTKLYSQYSA